MHAFRRSVLLGFLLAAVGLAHGLLLAPATAIEDDPATTTTELHLGWNLAGWTEDESDVTAIFEAIPSLELVLAWDPEAQWFRWAARDASGADASLDTLTPGMGLFLYIGGGEPVSWTRPVVAAAALIEAREGWNLVAWGGTDGVTVEDALSGRPELVELWGWSGERQHLLQHEPEPVASPRTSHELSRGGAIWIRSSAQARWLQQGWAQPRVVLLDDVAVEERAALRAGWESAQRFQAQHFGVITSDFTVYIGEHYTSIAGSYREAFGRDIPSHQCATAWGRAVFIVLSTCTNSPFAHEYFHIVQQHLSTHDYRETPEWLYEGSAEYVEQLQIQSLGVPQHYRAEVPRDRRQTDYLLWSTLGRPLTDHADESLDSSQRLTLNYGVGFLAVERLVDEAGRGALIDYFRLLASVGWRAAFSQAFGMSVDAFYAAFEAHRLEVAPPFDRRIQGTVHGSDGRPVEGVQVLAAVRVEGDPTPQVVGRGLTNQHGTFDFTGPGNDYFLVLWAQCAPRPSIVGGYGGEGFTTDWRNTPPFTGDDEDRTGIIIELPVTLAEFESRYCGSP